MVGRLDDAAKLDDILKLLKTIEQRRGISGRMSEILNEALRKIRVGASADRMRKWFGGVFRREIDCATALRDRVTSLRNDADSAPKSSKNVVLTAEMARAWYFGEHAPLITAQGNSDEFVEKWLDETGAIQTPNTPIVTVVETGNDRDNDRGMHLTFNCDHKPFKERNWLHILSLMGERAQDIDWNATPGARFRGQDGAGLFSSRPRRFQYAHHAGDYSEFALDHSTQGDTPGDTALRKLTLVAFSLQNCSDSSIMSLRSALHGSLGDRYTREVSISRRLSESAAIVVAYVKPRFAGSAERRSTVLDKAVYSSIVLYAGACRGIQLVSFRGRHQDVDSTIQSAVPDTTSGQIAGAGLKDVVGPDSVWRGGWRVVGFHNERTSDLPAPR